ncbi:MAG TPA: DUF2569 domain-containing protein [Pseudomonas sp.]|nr:DUF2569 domain-containing protein [Pseudomonas sp.]
MSDNAKLKGLGGWLILVGLGLIITPLRISITYGPMFYSVITDGTFETLTTPGTEYYHWLWAPLLVFEAIFNSCMLIACALLLYLFFTKHYLFPKVFIATILISLVFIPFDAWLGSLIFTDEPVFDPDTTKEFARTLFSAVIWVPYMLVSRRVEATFVKDIPE